LKTFTGHTKFVQEVVESRPNIIISGSRDDTVRIWNVSSQECLHILRAQNDGMVSFEAGLFATTSCECNIRVWSDDGDLIETIETKDRCWMLKRLRDGSIVTADCTSLDIRR